MNIAEWWPRLDGETRDWLMEHNGEPLPTAVVGAIVAAAGGATSATWWSGRSVDGASELTDSAIDWIEEKANDEDPGS